MSGTEAVVLPASTPADDAPAERSSERSAPQEARRVRVGVSLVVAVTPAVVIAAVIVASYATFALGIESPVAALVLTAGILAAVVAAARLRNPSAPLLARPTRAELAVLALWLLAVVWICGTTLRWSWFAPVTHSVDAAHHTGIAAELTDRWAMAGGFQLTVYPLGSHATAALVHSLTGLPVVTAVWWLGIGSVFATLLLLAVVTKSADAGRSWVGAPAALACGLLAWRYTVGVVTWDYFLGLAVAVHLLLAGLALVTWGGGARTRRRTWLPATLLLAAAIATTYPQLTPLLPAALVVTLATGAARDLRRAGSAQRRSIRRTVVALIGLGVLAAVALHRTGTTQRIWLSLTVVEEGYAARPSLTNVGGAPAVVAFALGLVLVLGAAVRLRSHALPIVTAFVTLAAITAVLWMLRAETEVFPGEAISNYRIHKLWYALVPLGAVMAGLAVGPVVRAAAAPWASRTALASLAIVSLGVATRPLPLSPTSVPYVGRDEWRLAEWTRRHHDPATVGLAGPGFAPYAVWWGALRRPTYGDDMVENQRIAYWSDWPGGTHDERYLLVIGRRLIADYLERPGVLPVRQIGRAALLERVGTTTQSERSDAASGVAEQGAPGL